MNRISLNVIVFNEEARLEECLEDARDFVDEIVVVDQMSTDATPEIAERLADVFVRDVHHGHAEPSRELAASRSSGDWILILDADERMSDRLKAELRELVERDTDGYWICKTNVVDGVETGTIDHYRLVRKSRVRFDPQPHGGARAVSDNVDRFDEIGIIHEKTGEEQLYDDARYDRMALEDDAPTSSKRNWLSHNHALREQRERERRLDIEALAPADDAVILQLGPDDAPDTLQRAAEAVRPGGAIVGTVPVARNRRQLEEAVGGVLGDGAVPHALATGGFTRRRLYDELTAAGLDVRWIRLVRDGWLDPIALRPDGTGAVVESGDFLLRNVAAEVAEELTAGEIVFSAVRPSSADVRPAGCSIVVAAPPHTDPQRFVDALDDTSPKHNHDIVVVHSDPAASPSQRATWVPVDETAGLAARWNAGARAASGELLVFVTATTEPLPGWLDSLIDAFQSRTDTGAAGSKVVGHDGTIEHAGLVLGAGHIPYRIYQGDDPAAAHVNRHRIVPAVAAEGMITSRVRFVEVGGFDETFGDDLTDADFCLRVRARGFPIVYAPSAALRSVVRAVPGTRTDFGRSARQFATRWSRTSFRSDGILAQVDGREVNSQSDRSWRLPRPTTLAAGGLPAIAWTSHFLEQGGYTEEALAAVEALEDAGLRIVANPVERDRRSTPLPTEQAKRLTALMERDLPDDFVHVAHIGANRFKRHPDAMRNVGRTMFETDGLPAEWRDKCNAMDEIWVPCEHNLHAFANAGVVASKLHKVPETFDADLFDPNATPMAIEGVNGFVFLSIFSWIRRKAWDVLLRAWFDEFDKHDDVTLLLKTDIDNAPGTDCRREVEAFVRGHLKRNPNKGPRVIVLDRPLETSEVPGLYRAADAFVLATRGEGWGRPLMEAMAMGLPTIATRWSGNLEFMDDDNSYLVDYKLVDAPHDPWTRGHRWAEPSLKDLRRALRRVYEHREEATATGARGRADVLVRCRPELVVDAVRDRIEAVDRHPVHVALKAAPPDQAAVPRRARRISACVVVHENSASLSPCLASLRRAAGEIVVVEVAADGDVGAARNEALDRAAGDWVLMLDATHTLDPQSIDLAADLARRDKFVAYTAREVHQFGLDGAYSSSESRTPVLFPRHRDLRYVGPVDAQLLPKSDDLSFTLVASRLVIHQHEDRWDHRDPVAIARRNLPALERAAKGAPHEPFHSYNLGKALERLGLHAEAETALRDAVDRGSARVLWAAPARVALARAVAAQGRHDEAVKSCKAATKCDPKWAQGWSALGDTLADAGRPDDALHAYERALARVDRARATLGVVDDTAWHVRAGMGRIHLARGDNVKAGECLNTAVALHPWSAELRVLLARGYEALGRSADALHHLEQATTLPRAGAQAHLAVGDFYTNRAEEALLRGLADNPESRVLRERIERLRSARAMT